MKKPHKSSWTPNPKNFKNAFFGLLLIAGIMFILYRLTELGRNVHIINFSTFLEKVDQNSIKKIHVAGQDIEGILKDGSRFETVISNNFNDWEKLRSHGIEFSIRSPSHQLNIWYLFLFACLITIIWAVWYFLKQRGSGGSNGGGNNIFTMGKRGHVCFYHQALKKISVP